MKTASAILLVLVAVGCAPQKRAAVEEAPNYYRVDPGSAATLTGVVRFTGKPPAGRRISMDAEQACESLHNGPVMEPAFLVNKGGEVANVLVYIKSGLEGKQFEPSGEAVVLDQRGCMFVPRVVALRAGQTLSVKNSDPVSHNIHPQPQLNREWNQHQAPEAPDLQRRFARPEVLIPVKCNVHSWMRSYLAVLDHPYFAVTDANGSFSWSNVPPGRYTVAVWHEKLGEMSQTLDIVAGANQTVDFTFKEHVQ